MQIGVRALKKDRKVGEGEPSPTEQSGQRASKCQNRQVYICGGVFLSPITQKVKIKLTDPGDGGCDCSALSDRQGF